MPKVVLDHIPTLARPDQVSAVLAEATGLRDKLREATERLAALQARLGEQEHADVEAAAQAIRKGSSPPTISAGIAKSRTAIEAQKRQVQAFALASGACETDVTSTILGCADEWRGALDAEAERGREAGRAAIAELEAACRRIAAASSAKHWLDLGKNGDFGNTPTGVWTASVAPSSRSRTANSEPLGIDELLGYVSELIDPPPPPVRPVLRTAASDAA
jgi:hypothetical protein